jgi:putative aldouronate transport system substrate-binding protein
MKRTFITMLSVVMTLSMLTTGCGSSKTKDTNSGENSNSESSVTDAGQFPIVKEPETLKLFLERGTMTDADKAKISENGVIKYLKEKTNISLDFTFLSLEDGKNKMILSFASGDYPDAAFLDWNTALTQADIMQYGAKEKIIIPLNDLIDKYGVETKKVFALRPADKAMITAPDGNIYGLPRFTECGHCMAYPKLWFNKAWLDKLGLKEPQTTDELEKVLLAFKNQDPNGNGKADEIPLTGSNDWSCSVEYWLMNSFIDTPAAASSTNPRPFLSMIDNKVTFIADRPEYKQGLEYMKKLYDQGLLSPADFTQNSEGLAQQVRKDEKLATVGAYTADHVGMGVDFNNKEILKQYDALAPVAGPNGVRFQPYQDPAAQLNGFNFVIFDKAANKEAAFRLADYMLSEEYVPISAYGIEGINWEKPQNAKNLLGEELKYVPITLPADATQEQKDKQANNSFWFGFMGDLSERRAGWILEPTEENRLNNYETFIEAATQKVSQYYPKVSLPRSLFMDKDTSEEFAELKTNITSHVVKNTSMFITGARPMSEWDTYVSELKKFGVDKYVEIYTKAYEDFQKNAQK